MIQQIFDLVLCVSFDIKTFQKMMVKQSPKYQTPETRRNTKMWVANNLPLPPIMIFIFLQFGILTSFGVLEFWHPLQKQNTQN